MTQIINDDQRHGRCVTWDLTSWFADLASTDLECVLRSILPFKSDAVLAKRMRWNRAESGRRVGDSEGRGAVKAVVMGLVNRGASRVQAGCRLRRCHFSGCLMVHGNASDSSELCPCLVCIDWRVLCQNKWMRHLEFIRSGWCRTAVTR